MPDIKIKGSEIENIVDSLSSIVDKKEYSNDNYVSINLKNECGKGGISIIKISEFITSINFDLTFYKDQNISFNSNSSHHIDFIYCLEGHLKQKLLNQTKLEPISFRQNSIFGRAPKTKNVITFLGDVHVKACVVIFKNENVLRIVNEHKEVDLRATAVKELSNSFEQKDFSYLGRICFKPAIYAKELFCSNNVSSPDLLFAEAAILNIMASQWEKHIEDSNSEEADAPLRQSELDQIIAVESFIISNISENLSIDRLVNISGLNPAKLQLGFNYLFNTTISSYVREKRLDKAAQLIQETDYNVSELVYSIGFSSRSYFSKIFKQRFGVLPSQCVSDPNLLMVV